MEYKGITFNGYQDVDAGFSEIWCSFDHTSIVFMSERLLVLFKRERHSEYTPDVAVTYKIGNDVETVVYQLDENDYCILDMTDYIRTYRNGCFVDIDENTYELNFTNTFFALIDPRKVLIPKYDFYTTNYDGTFERNMPIVPPLKGYADCIHQLLAEIYVVGSGVAFADGEAAIYTYKGRAMVSIMCDGEFEVGLYRVRPTVGLRIPYDYLSTDFMPCDRFAVVEWVSFTGATRRHIFKVKKSTFETDNEYSLLRLDGAPNEIKGREESFTLYMDDLCAYDYWYYSDIINSSNVQVGIKTDPDAVAEMRPVKVKTKKATIPDGNGGKWNTFEVECIYANYDAVNL